MDRLTEMHSVRWLSEGLGGKLPIHYLMHIGIISTLGCVLVLFDTKIQKGVKSSV